MTINEETMVSSLSGWSLNGTVRLWHFRFHRAIVLLAMGKVGVGLGWPYIDLKPYRTQSPKARVTFLPSQYPSQ